MEIPRLMERNWRLTLCLDTELKGAVDALKSAKVDVPELIRQILRKELADVRKRISREADGGSSAA